MERRAGLKYFRNLVLCFSGGGYGGRASGQGFEIQLGLFSSWSTRGHSTTQYPPTTTRTFWFAIILLIGIGITAALLDLFVQRIFGFPENADGHWSQLLRLGGYFYLLVATISFLVILRERAVETAREEREIWAYHATEHKVIVCVSNRLPPTPETLKRVPKTNIACGSARKACYFVSQFLMGLSFLAISTSNPVLFVVIFVLWGGRLIYERIITHELVDQPFLSLWMRGVVILTLPFTALPLLIEKFFFLHEPSDEILQEGVELAQQIYEDLGIVPEPES